MGERMFEDRKPEAAARQLSVVLAWLVECELATYAGLLMLKRPGAGNLRRHRDICAKAVFHAFDLRVEPKGLLGRECPRLSRLLDDLNAMILPSGRMESLGVVGAVLDRHHRRDT